jgi:class 3 adenylate cyclase
MHRDIAWAESIRKDWSYDRRVWASRLYPDGPVSLQRAFGKAVKDAVSPEMAARRVESHPDLVPLLSGVTLPTLVLLPESLKGPARLFGIQLSGLLPSGELKFVAGFRATPYPDHEPIVDAIFEFFDVGAPATPREASPSGMTAILFADIVDSTALTETMGDGAFREKARELDTVLRVVITQNGGTPIEGKLLGDGVLATFASARQAIEAALACGAAGASAGLPLHLGLHAGDVIREENNVFGGAVNIAARISGLSAPGEVLVSQTVRELARTSAGVSFADRGEHALKGVGDPVRVWAVWEGD